jgi:hypothetical protein
MIMENEMEREREREREREMERWWVLMFNYGKAKVRRESGGGQWRGISQRKGFVVFGLI